MKLENIGLGSGIYSREWHELDMSVSNIESIISTIGSLRIHSEYWKKSIESDCIETANFAYDWYMQILNTHINILKLRELVELNMKVLDISESNPNFRAIARRNNKLVIIVLGFQNF